MARISSAREIAFDVLTSVSAGQYASDLLRSRTRRLNTRDAGLASQLVYGCLRYRAQLDYLIHHWSGHSAGQLDLPVVIALRMAIYQLRYLERIPVHAAVHEAVELVKKHKRAAARLTNAVLRKVHRQPVAWPDLATELSCPPQLLERWMAHFGTKQARLIAEAALNQPAAYIRVPPGTSLPHQLAVEPTDIPGCFRAFSPIPPEFRLYDISSQAIIPLLDLRPGLSYLDLCAAPGNKTLQALEINLSLAVACDISLKRIREIPPICPRVVLDACRQLPFNRMFDRIFIDAPCSGTGTIGRNPEIKWRVTKGDFERFHEKQRQIISRALSLLTSKGKLLYATCSLEPEENEEIVQFALQSHPGLRCERTMWRIPGRDEGDGFYAALLVRG